MRSRTPATVSGGAALREAATFVLLAGGLAHLCFSWIGFTPTDEGFILAATRRLLDGQVPHRDFISIRPALPYLTFLPVLRFGGDYAIWLSRGLAWLELAAIGWCWAIALDRMTGARLTRGARLCLALVAFCLNAHAFPVMAWHSLDALVWASAGVALLAAGPRTGALGCTALGMSCLARQNFLPLLPGALWLTGSWRRPGRIAATLAPILVMAALLVALGAGPDARTQLLTVTDWVPVGVLRFAANRTMWWGLLGGFGAAALLARRRARAWGAGLLWALAGLAAATLFDPWYAMDLSFGPFGVVAGLLLWRASTWLRQTGVPDTASTGPALALLTAWCVAVSYGYNAPALMGGALTAVLLVHAWLATRGDLRRKRLLLAVTAVALVAFGWTRCRYVYRDNPAWKLTVPVGELVPGARLIRTNPRTGAFLAGLDDAVRMAGSDPYVIVPDVAVWWVRSARPNPLPIDWPEGFTLRTPALFARVTDAILAGRPRTLVIVERVIPDGLAFGFFPVPDDEFHKLVPWVRSHLKRVGRTDLFDLYR